MSAAGLALSRKPIVFSFHFKWRIVAWGHHWWSSPPAMQLAKTTQDVAEGELESDWNLKLVHHDVGSSFVGQGGDCPLQWRRLWLFVGGTSLSSHTCNKIQYFQIWGKWFKAENTRTARRWTFCKASFKVSRCIMQKGMLWKSVAAYFTKEKYFWSL